MGVLLFKHLKWSERLSRGLAQKPSGKHAPGHKRQDYSAPGVPSTASKLTLLSKFL